MKNPQHRWGVCLKARPYTKGAVATAPLVNNFYIYAYEPT